MAGSAVPPSRELADELGVSRGVVVDSYSQLTTEGYLTARRGSATRVAVLAPPARPPERRQLPPPARYRYELRPGLADYHRFPRAAWKSALVRALRDLSDGVSLTPIIAASLSSGTRSLSTSPACAAWSSTPNSS